MSQYLKINLSDTQGQFIFSVNTDGNAQAGTYATSVEYSFDNDTWSTLQLRSGNNTIQLGWGGGSPELYLRNDSGVWSKRDSYGYWYITISCSVDYEIMEGSLSALLDYNNDSVVPPTGAFARLFKNDTHLTTFMPEFVTETLSNNLCEDMFYGCTNLTSAMLEFPGYPTTIPYSCFLDTFHGCTSLNDANISVVEQADTFSDRSCEGMFTGCTGFTYFPSFPSQASTLASSCFEEMYYGCANANAPGDNLTLPATTLAHSCYKGMFMNCTSLDKQVILPATSVLSYSYQQMFSGCTSLSEVVTYADTIATTYPGTANWLQNVAATGTVYNMGNAIYTVDSASGIPVGWSEVQLQSSYTITATAGQNGSISPSGAVTVNTFDSQDFNFTPAAGYEVDTVTVDGSTVSNPGFSYFFSNVTADHTISVTFKELSDYFYIERTSGSGFWTITITQVQESTPTGTYATSIEYSTDGLNWIRRNLYPGTNYVSTDRNKVYFRNNSGNWSTTGLYNEFNVDNNVPHITGGNPNSLLDYTDMDNVSLSYSCFRNLFDGDITLTDASDLRLSATTLADGCYQLMFNGCTSLTTAPALPATTLANSCYEDMFGNCTSLTTAPSLPATTLAQGCYREMFSGCTSLNSVTTYANDISATDCTTDWLDNVAATGTFHNNGSATYTVDSPSGIPVGWTEVRPAPPIDYFYIENTYNGQNTVTLTTTQSGSPTSGAYATSVEYSKDKSSWTTLTLTAGGTNTITLESGEKVYFRNDSGKWNDFEASIIRFYTSFTANQNHTVGGNINTLLDYTDLNNITLSNGCFISLFSGDNKLTSVPSNFLPATTLAQNCYTFMFQNCSSLTSAPSLPATTLANSCYMYMFQNCTSLTTAPILPATTLANTCYDGMFSGCTALTTAPVLPATTLANSCYMYMFQNCTSLTTAPILPATTLANTCYACMFSGCTALTTAPSLPATTLLSYCYSEMFSGCTSLNSVTTYANYISAPNCISNWLNSVAATGTLYNNGSATYTPNSASGIPTGWTEVLPSKTITATAGSNGSISPSGAVTVNVGASQTFTVTPDTGYIVDTLTVDGSTATLTNNTYTFSNVQSDHTISVTFKLPDLTDYFYIENTYNGQNTVTLSTTGSSASQASSVEYSKDKNSWTTLTLTAGGTNTITLETGEKVYFRNDSGKWSSGESNYTAFSANQSHIVGGNVNTLINYTDLNNITLANYCFYKLFYSDSNLTSASALSLPSTTLANNCYRAMFTNCTSLTSAPSLPATTLAYNCYNGMFEGCTSLTTAPALPATTLAYNCYDSMFTNCRALTTAPTLPATTLAERCYSSMFMNCSSLTTAPSLPATTLANNCYSGMFRGCSFTTAPVLPATTLARGCYSNMFMSCSRLNEVTTYADDISAVDCTSGWLMYATTGGTLYNNGSATYTVDSPSGIPVGWTEVKPSKTITATAGQNGSISPSGAVSVNIGSDQTFTFTPDTGYEVDTVTVDGSTVTPTNNTYTFTNVQADHTISVTFKVQTFTINAISDAHTIVNPSGLVTVNYSASQTFTFTPEIGYELDKLYIDGVETSYTGSTYTFTNVQADHTLEITSKLMTFSIEATSSEGGSITPDGTVTVDYDGNASFEITPSTGYLLWELLVDGVDKKAELVDNTYTFENVTANHTIHAVFDDIYLIVSVTSGPNGSITPTGDVEVIYNGNQIFNITPNEGYEIDKVMLDGADVTDDVEDFNYILRNIVENHILEVSFKETYIPEPKGFNLTGMKNTDYAKQYKK